MRPLFLAVLLCAPVSAASIKATPGKASFGPAAPAWTQAVGYLLAHQPNLSSTLKLDSASLKAGDPKALKTLEPLIWALEGLGHEQPLDFLRLEPSLQAQALADAVSAAGKELSLQALALLQAEPKDETALREAAQVMARLRFAYGSHLPAEIMSKLASAHDAARAKLSGLTADKAVAQIEAAEAFWLTQSAPEASATRDSLPLSLAQRLVSLLDVVPPEQAAFSNALAELQLVSTHFADPAARRVIAEALMTKLDGPGGSKTLDALISFAAALELPSSLSQDAELQRALLRALNGAKYRSLEHRQRAMNAVRLIGVGSRSPSVRQLALKTLEAHSTVSEARDDPVYLDSLDAMREEVAKGLAEPKTSAPVPLQKLTLPVGPAGNN